MTTDTLVVPRSMRQLAIALCAIGVIAFLLGLFMSPESAQRSWLNLLIDGWFVFALGIASVFFIASQRLAN
jgi:hypothetical protein